MLRREAGQNHFGILRRALSMAIFRSFQALSGCFCRKIFM